MNICYAEYPEYQYEIASNLEKYQMTVGWNSSFSIGGTSTTDPVILVWNAQGGSTYYPNNLFSVIVYNDGEEVFRKNGINTTSYSFDLDEWQELLSDCGYKCGEKLELDIAIAAYQDDGNSHVTGPYYSALKTLTIDHSCRYETTDTTHSYICNDCGYTETKSHNFVCDGVENYLHYEKCTDCGYRANQMTDYQCASLNSTQHEKECNDCGHSEIQSHKVTKASLDGTYHQSYCSDCGHIILTEAHTFTYTAHPGRRHRKTCSCGYSTTEACVGRASIGGTSYCVNCGQEMTFVFNPMSVDEEEYLPNTKEDEENQD